MKRNGKRNQAYGKAQEYRCMDALSKMDGVELIEYYGQRKSKVGDFLMKIGKHQVRFDHKSSSSDIVIRLQKKWCQNLSGINLERMDEEGSAIPCISFGFFKKPKFYAMCTRKLERPKSDMIINTKYNICPITSGMLIDNHSIYINFDGYVVYVYKLETFVERIKEL